MFMELWFLSFCETWNHFNPFRAILDSQSFLLKKILSQQCIFNNNFYSFFNFHLSSKFCFWHCNPKTCRAATFSFVRMLRFCRKNWNIYRAVIKHHLLLNRTNSRVLRILMLKLQFFLKNIFQNNMRVRFRRVDHSKVLSCIIRSRKESTVWKVAKGRHHPFLFMNTQRSSSLSATCPAGERSLKWLSRVGRYLVGSYSCPRYARKSKSLPIDSFLYISTYLPLYLSCFDINRVVRMLHAS